jgi:hypothetical protein
MHIVKDKGCSSAGFRYAAVHSKKSEGTNVVANPWIIGPLEITIRLLLALLLGGLVGLEREQKNHPAGLRTHLLVSLGSCLIMLLSIYGFSSFLDSEKF